MKEVSLILPNQLFKESGLLQKGKSIFLVEEDLFFNQYSFHKKKLVLHRASMKFYQDYVSEKGLPVHYIEANDPCSDIRELLAFLKSKGTEVVHLFDPVDDWILRRLITISENYDLNVKIYENPGFINDTDELKEAFDAGKARFFQTDFYKKQRLERKVLIDPENKPFGGKWTYDSENRKKYPKNKPIPHLEFPKTTKYWKEAIDYVDSKFPDNLGDSSNYPVYPHTFEQTESWLNTFLNERFYGFGPYEDAIVKNAHFINHSVLTPMLNIGLITANELMVQTLHFLSYNDYVPINSSEGFVRQIMGWREFIRAVYIFKGREERTTNFWGFDRKIPESFYDGTTGIEPVDNTIRKILETGYCHHIERLMILGNFMLLCEFDPDEVYRWFMEMFIDSYDWVMVPNVYGMSQFADGGIMSTKPYISGSNYVLKMSDYKKGEWSDIWDALFWRFLSSHREVFEKNPRMRMLLAQFDKRSSEKRDKLINQANDFLNSLAV